MALTFDANYYLTQRPDVFQAFVATAGSTGLTWAQFAQQHYNNHGRFEGSNPNAVFNTDEYLAANVDVAAAGVNPFEHYLTHGVYEGRAPSASFPARDAFDWEAYVAANPDLGEAGIDTAEEAYAHFVLHGQFENRPGTPDVDNGIPGQTITLTNAIDNRIGTVGDDTFLGDNTSANPADTLNGGAGTDTVKLYNTTTVPNMISIENIEYHGAPTGTVNVAKYTDLVSVSLIDTDVSGGAVGLTVSGTQTVTLSGVTDTADNNNDVDINTAASVTSLAVNLNGVGTAATDVEVDINGTGLATLNVNSSAANNISLINTGAALRTLNVEGGAQLTIANELVNITTIDASKSTGGVSVMIDDTRDVKFTGGSGNDRVNIQNAGLSNLDVSIGGAGTDTLVTSQAITEAAGAGISEFEILNVSGDIAQDVDAIIAKNALTGIQIGLGANTVNNINAGAANNIAFVDDSGATTLDVKSFTVGGLSDTATIILDNSIARQADGVDVGTVTFDEVDVLTINSKSDGTPAAAEQNSITLAASDLEKLTITGDQSVSVVLAAATSQLTEVDASGATASVTVDGSALTAAQVLVTGSSKADVLDFDSAATKATIYGGGGGDTINLDTTADDIIVYKAGSDSFAGAVGGVNNFDTINGFGAAGNGNKIDISAFGFTGTQAAVLDKTAVLADVTAATLEVAATSTANFFVDVGNIYRGVAMVDLGADLAIYVDVNKNGALDADDLALKLVGTGAVLTAADFTF